MKDKVRLSTCRIPLILLSTFCAIGLIVSLMLSAGMITGFGSLALAKPGDTTSENTDHCPFRSNPPPAVDTSEVPKSGIAPAPLPVQYPPIGGYELGECGVIVPPGAPPLPKDITATSWLLADLDSGKVLAAKDPHGRYRPASTIKLLLAYTVMQHLPLTMLVHGIPSDALVEGDHLGVNQWGDYTVETLLEGLLLISGNDAAVALSRALGGEKRTLELMNDNARKLWALDTRAASVSGLDAPGMSISPYDEALILRAVLKNPDLHRILQMHSAFFHSHNDATGRTIIGQNRYVVDNLGGIGGKTGYTDDAEKTYVGAVNHDGRNMIVVQMYGFSVGVDSYWHQSDELLDWGAHLPRNLSVGELVTPTITSSYPLWKPIALQPATHMVMSGANNYQWISWLVLLVCVLALILVAYIWKNMRDHHVRYDIARKNSVRERRLTSANNTRNKRYNSQKLYPEKASYTEQELYFRNNSSYPRENTLVGNYSYRSEQRMQRNYASSPGRNRTSNTSYQGGIDYNRNPPSYTDSYQMEHSTRMRALNSFRQLDSEPYYSAYDFGRDKPSSPTTARNRISYSNQKNDSAQGCSSTQKSNQQSTRRSTQKYGQSKRNAGKGK